MRLSGRLMLALFCNASAGGQPPEEEIFLPLSSEVAHLASSLKAALAAALEGSRQLLNRAS